MYVQALTESQKECERAQQATAELKQRESSRQAEWDRQVEHLRVVQAQHFAAKEVGWGHAV